MRTKIFLIIFLIILAATLVNGHETQVKQSIFAKPTTYIIFTSILTILISALIVFNKSSLNYKKTIFLIIVIPVIGSSLYLATDTILKNLSSETKGPIHWHADYQVWGCGDRLDLVNPRFPRNKIGTPLFHEHNDDRIHVEGTVKDLDLINLREYFEIIGGQISPNLLIYPTTTGLVELNSCPDGPSTLKVYVNGKKIDYFENYIPYPNSRVPPGDCIIFLFDNTNEDTTNILCESWAVQGWNYQNYERPKIKIGDKAWQ